MDAFIVSNYYQYYRRLIIHNTTQCFAWYTYKSTYDILNRKLTCNRSVKSEGKWFSIKADIIILDMQAPANRCISTMIFGFLETLIDINSILELLENLRTGCLKIIGNCYIQLWRPCKSNSSYVKLNLSFVGN